MPPPPPSFSADNSSGDDDNLATILAAARPFLRGELELADPELPNLVSVLRAAGAGECWHKHGSFLAHLVSVHRILHLWRAPPAVARCGLYHSAYSNSYVNLAIFDPGVSRGRVAALVGADAERLVHLFCVVPRHRMIHDDLLFHYSDAELTAHLAASASSLRSAADGLFDDGELWRRKLRAVLPPGGVAVKHIRTGEDVQVSRRMAAVFLLMTMADFSDQLFDWQDSLFDNADGRLAFAGDTWTALWPGLGKPGLWMNSISRMGALYALVAREEEIYMAQRHIGPSQHHINGSAQDNINGPAHDSIPGREPNDRDEDIELVIPPVFERCTKILDTSDQLGARDLYWEAVTGDSNFGGWEKAERLLVESGERNPFVGEPHLVLAQVRLNMGRYEEAEVAARRGLRLLLEWGSSWDKRMTWEGWVAWGRVLLAKAKEKAWPNTSFGVINLGLVD